MSDLEITPMDLVRELRLRQWARQNYVPLESRRVSWHPVVLDEMLRRDSELLSDAALVTFEPATLIQGQSMIEVAAATEIEEPDSATSESFEPHLGSRFVPLVPDTHFRLDEGCGDIPKPHAWARVAHSHYLPAFLSSSSID